MMYMYYYTSVGIFFLILSFAFFSNLSDASHSDTMNVEANILASNTTLPPTIRVSVPDYLFFGNVSKGTKSNEITVYVNNTGTVGITVTPQLVNSSEDIFSYLYFRKTKTKTINGTSTDVNFTRIGGFSFNITKPASGSTFKAEYFYVVLDLMNYSGTINNDIIGYKADVKFLAVEQ